MSFLDVNDTSNCVDSEADFGGTHTLPRRVTSTMEVARDLFNNPVVTPRRELAPPILSPSADHTPTRRHSSHIEIDSTDSADDLLARVRGMQVDSGESGDNKDTSDSEDDGYSSDSEDDSDSEDESSDDDSSESSGDESCEDSSDDESDEPVASGVENRRKIQELLVCQYELSFCQYLLTYTHRSRQAPVSHSEWFV